MRKSILVLSLAALTAYLAFESLMYGAPIWTLIIYPIQIFFAISISYFIIEMFNRVIGKEFSTGYRNSSYLVSAGAFHIGANIGIIYGYGELVSAITSVIAANIAMLSITYIGKYSLRMYNKIKEVYEI